MIDIKTELEKRSKKYLENLSQRNISDENFEKMLKLICFEMGQCFTEFEFYWRVSYNSYFMGKSNRNFLSLKN